MKIVIDIPEKICDFVQNTSFVEDESTLFKQTNAERKKTLVLFDIIDAIRNGTPLPKGHGRIGDLDVLKNEVSSWGMNDYEPSDFIDEIDRADTIIEADKEEE